MVSNLLFVTRPKTEVETPHHKGVSTEAPYALAVTV